MTVEEKQKEVTQKLITRVPHWWNKSTTSNFYNLSKSFAHEMGVQYIEIDNLKIEISVNTASGKRLDDLGNIFKLKRWSNESDDSFRARIKSYWPGFSGGGTIPSIKSTINRITGVPEADIEVIEVDFIKFRAKVLLDSEEDLLLQDTIVDTVWKVKGAGIYPFIEWILGGDLLKETLTATDSVNISYISSDPSFIISKSLIDGSRVIW